MSYCRMVWQTLGLWPVNVPQSRATRPGRSIYLLFATEQQARNGAECLPRDSALLQTQGIPQRAEPPPPYAPTNSTTR